MTFVAYLSDKLYFLTFEVDNKFNIGDAVILKDKGECTIEGFKIYLNKYRHDNKITESADIFYFLNPKDPAKWDYTITKEGEKIKTFTVAFEIQISGC